jgi:DNA-binding HxlR family transcriptional regulator
LRLFIRKEELRKHREDNNTEKTVVNIWEVLGMRWSLFILKNLSTKEVIRFMNYAS